MPRKSPDLQCLRCFERGARGPARDAPRQDRALILAAATPRCPVTMSPPWAPGLASDCGLQRQSEVRGARSRPTPGPGLHPRGSLHAQPRVPIASGASFWRRFLAAFLGLGRRAPAEPAWRPQWPASTALGPGPRGVHASAAHYRPRAAPPSPTCSLVTDWPRLRACGPDLTGGPAWPGAGLPDQTSPAEAPWAPGPASEGSRQVAWNDYGAQRPSGDKSVFGAEASVRHLGLISGA